MPIKPDKFTDVLESVHEYSLNLANNEIFLFGIESPIHDPEDSIEPGVEYQLANRFIRNMALCRHHNPDMRLLIHMKTCGGFWEEGMAIYDTIATHPTEVTILNYTHARSMSSIIFQAADKRIMMPDSYFMLHDGTYGDYGTVKQVRAAWNFFEPRTRERMIEIYAAQMARKGLYAGNTFNKLRQILNKEMDKKEDVYFTADETIAWGLADRIFDGDWDKL